MSLDDTIAAVSTPVGEGGIGIVRLSGNCAITIADRIFRSPRGSILAAAKSRSLIHGFVVDTASGERIDEVLASVMRAPATYTREDVVEINCHSGLLPLRRVLQLVLDAGARLAEPGEFTKRAFLNGRIDLTQAEAVMDFIRARTDQAGRIAQRQLEGKLSSVVQALRDEITDACVRVETQIDFPEEEIETIERDNLLDVLRLTREKIRTLSREYDEGRYFREGVATAIVGKPNVGKSSLLNLLLQRDRAIVTETPGTTRDVIEDSLNMRGLPLRVMDTAGIREAHDLAEREGVRRSLKAIEEADLVIAVLDSSRPVDEADRELVTRLAGKRTVYALNKCDIESPLFRPEELWHSDGAPLSSTGTTAESSSQPRPVRISARTGEGTEDLKDEICGSILPQTVQSVGAPDFSGPAGVLLITNMRHKQSLDRAFEGLGEAEVSLNDGAPLEVVALFLRESLDHLGEIIGVVTTEDILNRIFDRFCIGK
jgi:tRNA modification GTPase